MTRLILTERALGDLVAIEDFSVQRWGRRVTDEYLSAIDGALNRLRETPGLLWLRFYRVEKHWLLCDRVGDDIYALTVRHGAMDLPARISELEPERIREAEIMRRRFTES